MQKALEGRRGEKKVKRLLGQSFTVELCLYLRGFLYSSQSENSSWLETALQTVLISPE